MHTVVIDEAVGEYEPSTNVKEKAAAKREPIPIQCIPRKPHPNGLLYYCANGAIQNPMKPDKVIPYYLLIKPHLQLGDGAPREFVKDFKNW